MREKSCVIIGAGLAGLSAGYKLTENGWKITIVEARDRIGGRVYSHRFHEAPDLYCELGGEWVGREHNRVRTLCKKFKLPLIPHRFDFSFAERGKITERFRAGQWPFEPSLKDVLKKEANKIVNLRPSKKSRREQQRFDQQDWWTFLRDIDFSLKDRLRRDLMDSTDFGESIRHSGAYSAAAEYYDPKSSNRYDEMDFRIKGGNTLLVNALSDHIGLDAIHTSTEAVRVSQTRGKNGHVTVWTKDNRTEPFPRFRRNRERVETGSQKGLKPFCAGYCICTVPVRVLTDIDFDPPLSPGHSKAAKDLQYARIMKTVVLFEERFWLENKTTKFSCFTDNASDFIFDATLGQPFNRSKSEGILCSYAIGDKADDLAARGTEELRRLIEQDLTRLFPGKNTRAIAIERYAWQEDKYTQGAYAFYRPGQWFPVRDALGTPLDEVFFAGEHLADEQGFMDGAIDTGEDAAKAVVKAQAATA
jgi:monoamine oxidase